MFFYSMDLQAMPTNQSVQLVSNLAASDLDVKRRSTQCQNISRQRSAVRGRVVSTRLLVIIFLQVSACKLCGDCAIIVLNMAYVIGSLDSERPQCVTYCKQTASNTEG